jgi:amino acid permease
MELLIGFVGVFLQILIAVNKFLVGRNFDLTYWWSHNKVATIVGLIITVGASYALTKNGFEVEGAVGLVLNLLLGYFSGSLAHHTLKVKKG